MYYKITLEGTVKIPPTKLGDDEKTSIKEALIEELEGKILPDLGVILAILEIKDFGEGLIYPGDPNVYYDSTFEALVYLPELHEFVEGEVVEILEFGAFVRIGPIDGLVHVSQLMDDYVQYDGKNKMFIGKETKNKLKIGDVVLGKIVAISLKKDPTSSKIGLTLRQEGLGKEEWIEKKRKKVEKNAKRKSV